MSKWIKYDGGTVDTGIPSNAVESISENGTYYLYDGDMDKSRPFVFGASTKTATHTATIQLFAEVAGARLNLGDPITTTFGSPVIVDEEYTLTGRRGIIVSGLTGIVFPEADQ